VPWTIGSVRTLLIWLCVLIVLVVGVDIGGRAFAESKAGEAIGAKAGIAAPTVVIHGFSFLVQAVPGHYSNITLTSSDVTAGPITGIDATMELYNVDLPLGDALKGDTSHFHAALATLHGVIADDEITAAMGQADTTISAGTNGAIRVSTTVTVAGQSVKVTADLHVSFASGALKLDAVDLTAGGVSLPNVADLTKNLSLALPLKDLPFTVDSATLTASGTNLILTATANDVRVGATT
jgi:hypothetical protein